MTSIKRTGDVPSAPVQAAGAERVRIQWLIGHEDRPANFYMRLFEVEPGGHTVRHGHAWEHEIYVLEGEGTASTPEGERTLGPGSVVYVPPETEHQFRATGERPLRFLCLVPKTAEY